MVIQNNWIMGAENKRHRFREAGLWRVDPPAYYLGRPVAAAAGQIAGELSSSSPDVAAARATASAAVASAAAAPPRLLIPAGAAWRVGAAA